MITAGIQKYSYQVATDRVISFLKQNKEIPHSIEEISYATHLTTDIVRHILHDLQYKSELCWENNKFYFPENKMRWWLVAWGLMIACAYTAFELIKYYHI